MSDGKLVEIVLFAVAIGVAALIFRRKTGRGDADVGGDDGDVGGDGGGNGGGD